MSMFNDIDLSRRGNDENLFFEFSKSQGIREEIFAGTLDVSRSWRRKEVVWNSSIHTWRNVGLCSHSNGGTIQRYRSSSFQEYQCFESWTSEKEEWQSHHTLQGGCFEHRTAVPNHSFCKSAQYHRAVSIWCEQFGFIEEEKGQEKQKESVTKGVLTSVKSQEVKLLVSFPRQVCGRNLRENIQDFESLDGIFGLTLFKHRVSARRKYQTRLDEDDGFGQFIPSCREYTLSQNCPQSRIFAAILGETIVVPVILYNTDLKLQLYHPMIENGHPMLWFPERRVGSWMIFILPMANSDPVQNYSLNFRNQKEENLAWQSRRPATRTLVWPMFQVRLASRKLVRTLSAFLLAKRPFTHEPFLRPRGSGKLFLPILRMEDLLSIAVSKMVTRMVRHYDQDERQSDEALHWDTIRPVLLKPFARHGARDFSEKHWLRLVHEGSSKTRFEYCEDSNNSLAYFQAIQGHSGGISIDRRLMRFQIPYNWKEYFFLGVFLAGFDQSSRMDWFRVERKAREDGRLSSSHHLTLLVEIPRKKNTTAPCAHVSCKKKRRFHCSSTSALPQSLETQSGCRLLGNITPSTKSRTAILANEVTCNHRTQSCASRLHLQSNLSERRSNTVRKTKQKSHWKAVAFAAAAVYQWWCVDLYKETYLYGILSQLLRKGHSTKLICKFTRRRKDERNQGKVGKVQNGIKHKILS